MGLSIHTPGVYAGSIQYFQALVPILCPIPMPHSLLVFATQLATFPGTQTGSSQKVEAP